MQHMIEKYFQQIIKFISKFPLTTLVEVNTVLGSEEKSHITATIKLDDGSELHLFEFVALEKNTVVVKKYRYHWQDSSHKLIRRWDNAKHHPNLDTFPHHIHVQEKENVQPHEKTDLKGILEKILDYVTRET